MQGLVSYYFFLRVCIVVILVWTISACHRYDFQGIIIRQTPRTVLYSYAIANGMARGRFMTKPLYLAQEQAILKADHDARAALRFFGKHPSRSTLQQAGQKVEKLIGVIEAQKTSSSQIMR